MADLSSSLLLAVNSPRILDHFLATASLRVSTLSLWSNPDIADRGVSRTVTVRVGQGTDQKQDRRSAFGKPATSRSHPISRDRQRLDGTEDFLKTRPALLEQQNRAGKTRGISYIIEEITHILQHGVQCSTEGGEEGLLRVSADGLAWPKSAGTHIECWLFDVAGINTRLCPPWSSMLVGFACRLVLYAFC